MLFQRGKAYSQDLRERVFAASDEGDTVGRIAERLRVSGSYVSKVLGRRRLTGVTTAMPQRCHVAPKLAFFHDAIRAEVAARPDVTIAELVDWVLVTHTLSVSVGAMWGTLSRLGLRLKKSRSWRPNRTDRTLPRRAKTGVKASRN
jgi:transposase